MNFPGKSIDEMVLEQPDEMDDEPNDESDVETANETSENGQGKSCVPSVAQLEFQMNFYFFLQKQFWILELAAWTL